MDFPHFKKYTNMENGEVNTSTGTIINIEGDKEIIDFVDEKTKSIANKGVLLGLNESVKSLNMFLDKKVSKGLPDYISRHELNLFMKTYIEEYEKGIK